ncbi:MAG: Mur ligase family protein [Patescibacteria group bacterium]|nr:Mur ligase family protein [Patescibacteria group bacterium]
MDKFPSYYKAVNFLEGLANMQDKHNFTAADSRAVFFLKRTEFLLNLLGHPERSFKSIHVAGTSGKGSVSALIHSALVVSGKKAGLFTSPFVTTTVEKIQAGAKYISPKEFTDLVEKIKPALDEMAVTSPYGPASYFEALFAMAALYFKKQKCEWAVLEVGCGGRFDATNAIPAPKISIITNIGLDHTKTLGKTLKKIAFEKAGIIKKGSNFWTTEQRPKLLVFFKNTCKNKGTKFHHIEQNKRDYAGLNRELARQACRHIGLKEKDIKKGFSNAFTPCRFETMQTKPLIILDGAHNEDKIKSTVYNLQRLKYKKLFLIIGMAGDKDHSKILKMLVPLADRIFITRFELAKRKCADPGMLYHETQMIKKKGARLFLYLDPNHALKQALKLAGKNDAILATGSFYLVGKLREHWYPEEWILTRRKSR